MSEQVQVDPAVVSAIAAGVAAGMREKAAGSTPTGIYAHGPGGLMSQPGMNPDVANAMVLPRGLGSMLPVMRTTEVDQIFAIMTGQTASSGTEPTTACADATQAGFLKICRQVLPFGRTVKDSQVLVLDDIGRRVNRGEFLDYRFINNPLANLADPALPVDANAALNSENEKQLLELMVAIHRDYGPKLYTGNPANTASSTGYIEYYGLDYQINDGHQDAISKDLCPAADSIIRPQNGLNVRTSAATALTEIVETVAALNKLAADVGADVQLALVGRYGLFRALTEVWPCTYASYRCLPVNSGANSIDASMQMNMIDGMRRGNYLLVDGREVPFIIDDFVTETTPATGIQQSDLYIVPMRVNNRPSLYWQYFDLNNAQLRAVLAGMAQPSGYMILSQGRFLLYKKAPTNLCVQYGLVWKPRVILEFPFLAARLTDFRYSSVIHERGWDPADPYYFVNGGVYNMANYGQYFYPPTNA